MGSDRLTIAPTGSRELVGRCSVHSQPSGAATERLTMSNADTTLRLGLPKGRMQDGVFRLLADAGIGVTITSRDYRPGIAMSG